MSIEAVNQFLTKVKQDQQLQSEVSQAMSGENKSQATIKIAAKHGYKFSAQELDSRIEQLQTIEAKQSTGGKLSEEELEAVSGGLCTPGIVFAAATPFAKKAGEEAVEELGPND